jgi:hypothetical protein
LPVKLLLLPCTLNGISLMPCPVFQYEVEIHDWLATAALCSRALGINLHDGGRDRG